MPENGYTRDAEATQGQQRWAQSSEIESSAPSSPERFHLAIVPPPVSPEMARQYGSGSQQPGVPGKLSLGKLSAISCIAGGVQFGWAIQLSLLTPYVQTLGIPHAWASFIWLCGPISGLLVQPVVGVWSDKCTHRWGRRRPFILAGSLLICIAVLLIGYSSELGFMFGDDVHGTPGSFRPYACAVFVLGFWFLDLSNNTVQGPSRALLADLTRNGVGCRPCQLASQFPFIAVLLALLPGLPIGQEQCNAANSFYSFWIAVGSVLGYSAGANGSWYRRFAIEQKLFFSICNPSSSADVRWFPALTSEACGEPCANLKAAFLLHVVFLCLCTGITCASAKEQPLEAKQRQDATSAGVELQIIHSPEKAIMVHQNGSANGHTETRQAAPEETGERGEAGEGSGAGTLTEEGGPEADRSSLESSAPVGSGQGFSLAQAWRMFQRRLQALGAKEGEDVLLRPSRRGSSSSSSSCSSHGHASDGPSHVQAAREEDAGMLAALRMMPPLMHVLLAITALSWVAWFPFLLFDTDWMGREVFHGDPNSTAPPVAEEYQAGVREGALGLLLFAVVQGVTSAWLDPLCRRFGPALVWGAANLLTAACMLATCLLSFLAAISASFVSSAVVLAALCGFALLGAPFAVTLVIPFTLAAQCSSDSGFGRGLSMGILNLGIVVPQILVSLLAGPLDGLFGGGNVPAFTAAAVFAVIAAFCSFTFLPKDLVLDDSIDSISVPSH